MAIDRKKLQSRLNTLRHIKTWQLFIILIFMVLISASLLRLNNLNMVDMRKAVTHADDGGNKEEIKQSLLDLQKYVSSHMNTNLAGGIYLEASYQRDRAIAIERASDQENPASEVYKQASIDCRSRFQGGVESYRNDYVACVQERVAALGSADEIASANLPQVENYHYNFVSPLWSPDLAGFSVAVCALIVLVIFSRWIVLLILRLLLSHRFKSV